MPYRHAISDEKWERIKGLLPGKKGDPGVTAKDNRLFIDAVLWIAKTGAPWRDLPERFGNWNSAWKRFSRWARKGRWEKLFLHFQDEDLEWLVLDSTIIRAHPHAAGAKKKPTAAAGRPSRLWARAGAAGGRRSTPPSAG
jgi:transposase